MPEVIKKYRFVCLEEKCMKEGGPCIVELFSNQEPDWPSYCPWEMEPTENKFVEWRMLK